MQTDFGMLGVTLSVGVSSLNQCEGETLLQIVERADRALYRAKQAGRTGSSHSAAGRK